MQAEGNIRRVYVVTWSLAQTGGMERHVVESAAALARTGIDVTVFTELPVDRNNPHVRQLRGAGVSVIQPGSLLALCDSASRWPWGARVRGMLQRVMGILHHVFRFFETARGTTVLSGREEQILGEQNFHPLTRNLLRTLAAAARRAPPDVVHLHGCRFGQNWAVTWADVNSYPTVYTEHTTMLDWGGSFDGGEVMDRAVDALCCVSASARDSMKTELPFPRDIFISRHIIFGPEQWTSAKLTPTPALLCVARLEHYKGIDILLHAAHLIHRAGVAFHLRIAGAGTERKKLEDLASSLSLGSVVEFLGDVPYTDIAGLWKGVHLGVQPSRTEGLPLSIVEAMSHGRAVVATRVGGIPEIVLHQENGWLVVPDDAPALACAMRQLIEVPVRAEQLGAAARLSFESGGWSEGEVTRETLAIYEHARERRLQVKATRMQGKAWVHNCIAASAGGVRKVHFVLWSLAAAGEMEQTIADQASALAWSGIDVTVFAAMPVLWNHYFARRMRASGVRIAPSSLFDSAMFRLAHAPSVERIVRSKYLNGKPDVVHVHGWCLNMARVLAIASAQGIPTVYTEHANEDTIAPAQVPAFIPSPRTVLSATSESPRLRLERLGCTNVTELGHAFQRRRRFLPEAAPAGSQQGVRVLSFLTDCEQSSFRVPAGVLLESVADAEPEQIRSQIRACASVLLSPGHKSFDFALMIAMSLPRPIILCGAPDVFPIRARVNGWIASVAQPETITEALLELRDDPLLAQAFAHAARRSFESIGLRDLEIAAEAVALYREAQSRQAIYAG